MRKRFYSWKQIFYYNRTRVQIIIPLVIISGIWGYIISGMQGVYRFTFFSFVYAVLATITNNLDKITVFYTRKHLSFITSEIIKLAVLLVSSFVVLQLYISHVTGEDFRFVKDNRKWIIIGAMGATIISTVINLLSILQRMIGHRTILRYLSGRYHNPREEEHILMFIDLKDSTTIAEKLGHKRFFSLINELMEDLYGPIIDNDGDIYKFVGDELIITWRKKKGIKNNNCLNLYFNVKERMHVLANDYKSKYGIYPVFKAGLHYGKVVVGEIGALRSEIAYMGDAVNTTARIQAECNKQEAELLISEDLLKELLPDNSFHFDKLGLISLKGKRKEIELYKVSQNV